MQYLKITESTTLSDLISQVGARNVDAILALNMIERTPNIGAAYTANFDLAQSRESVKAQTKITRLNTMTSDSDVFETASLLSEGGWKYLEASGSLPDTLKIPETITLPSSTSILGDGQPISRMTYDKTVAMLKESIAIDPSIFNEYSSRKGSTIVDTTA